MSIHEEYKALRRDLNLLQARQQIHKEQRAKLEKDIDDLRTSLFDVGADCDIQHEAYRELEKALKRITNEGHRSMEKTVDKALKVAVPKRNYRSSIQDYIHARNGLSTDISIVSPSIGQDIDPKHQSGEATKQILSVSLLFSFIGFSPRSRFIFFDESFGGVGPHNIRNIGQIIQTLAVINDFQIFIVNQEPAMFDVEGMRVINFGLNEITNETYIISDSIVENSTGDSSNEVEV